MYPMTVLFKALADGNRLRGLAALLAHDELCACQITELMQVSGATASRHMGVLMAAGLVTSRKDGRWVHYRLSRRNAAAGRLMQWLERELKLDPEAKKNARKLQGVIACTPEVLCRRQRGEAFASKQRKGKST